MQNTANELSRKPVIAFVLSLLLPGLGQTYAGRGGRGYATYFLGIAIVLGGGVFLLNYFPGLVLFLILYLAWHVLAAIDSSFCVINRPLSNLPKIWNYISFALCFLVCNFLFMGLFRFCCFQTFKVPSSTMAPTIRVDDYIVTRRISTFEKMLLGKNLKRGDIVVFTLPEDPNTYIVKRLVGMPGENIEVKRKDVFVNQNRLEEPYASYVLGGKRNFPLTDVPPQSVFLLGDNRDQSNDSRYWSSPFLPMERIIGVAQYVYWNPHDWRERIGVRLDSTRSPNS